jgi:uncharacterized membrane protein HdeD (DUF308 family)
MQPDSPSQTLRRHANIRNSFRNLGLGFAALGVAAILAPVVATLVVEQLVAWLFVFWGLAGLASANSFRAIFDWRIVTLFFAAVLIIGLSFVFFPDRGAAFITGFIVIAFLLDGALSITFGLRLRNQISSWRWIIASGASAVILGAVILVQWPTTSTWVLGFLIGVNFLSTGISMLLMSRSAGKLAR